MTRLRAALVLTVAAAALGTAAPASAGFCFQPDPNACFDDSPEPIPSTWDAAVYVACRIVSDGGGGC